MVSVDDVDAPPEPELLALARRGMAGFEGRSTLRAWLYRGAGTRPARGSAATTIVTGHEQHRTCALLSVDLYA